jgi:serine protease inhibitor
MNGILIACVMSFLTTTNIASYSVPPPGTDVTAESVRSEVVGNNEFAFRLYARLAGEEGNVLLSPYSIRTALAMSYAGAEGRTARQMRQALHLRAGDDVLQHTLAKLAADLVGVNTKECELAFASSLWGQMGFAFRPEFLDLLRETQGAGYQEVDFATSSEDARRVIDEWVAGKTKRCIDELLAEGDLGDETLLVLVNTGYFRGTWPVRFAAENTRVRPFFVPPREGEGHGLRQIAVPTMYQRKEFGCLRQKDLSLIELPYAGERLSMVILLPGDPEGLPRLEAALSPEFLASRLEQLRSEEMAVFLPRFSLASRFQLGETLQAMGMIDAFGPDADFSKMVEGDERIFMENTITATALTVDEAGTEAAGVTAVMMSKGDHAVIHINHPFLFLIRDRTTGTILFLGRVTDPAPI